MSNFLNIFSGQNHSGSAIYSNNVEEIKINNCNFINNSVDNYGGAVAVINE